MAARWPAAAAILIVALQLMPVHRSNPPATADLSAPPEISSMLRDACYDCHSNHTRWPWYSAIAPVSWIVYRDVAEGRRRLNFSDWDAYASDPGTARRKLTQIADLVIAGKMAPWYYRALHPRARLDPAQRRIIARWAATQAQGAGR